MKKLLNNKEQKFLLFVAFLASGADNLFGLALVFHLKSFFLLDSMQIGIFSALQIASYFLSCIIFEKFYEKLKPMVCIALACGGMFLFSLFMGITKNLNLFLVLLVLYGAIKSLLWPQLAGLITRGKEGKMLNRTTGKFNFAWSSALGISPFFSGFIAERSTTLSFFVTCLIMMLAFVFIINNNSARIAPSDKDNSHISNMLDNSTYLRYFTWVGIFLAYFVNQMTQIVFPIYALEVLHISETTTGTIISIKGIVVALMFIFFGRFDFWHFKISWIIFFQLLVGVAALVLANISSVLGFILLFILIGICFSALYSFSIFHGMSGTVNKSRRMMIHEVVLAISCVVGSVVGGAVYKAFDWRYLMQLCFNIVFIVVVLEFIVLYLRKRSKSMDLMLSWTKKKGKEDNTLNKQDIN